MDGSVPQPGLISVIMPVYNAEKTLARSAASVLSQTYPRVELILVDDGSKDESLRLCREIEKSDPRVRVIAQKNGGAAAARNAALNVLRGEFVMFADSDDLLVPDACQAMLDAIWENDLVIAHYYFDIPGMLTDEEVCWIDEYHRRVREVLLPLLNDDSEREWLLQATESCKK